MVDERAQAISLAEYYFSLADGIFPGLESHLAKNVVLDWFGRKIKGKENVTAFITSDKTSSLHVFTDIKSISGIVYNKKKCNRKRKIAPNQIADNTETKLESDTSKWKAIRMRRLYKNAVKHLDEAEIIYHTMRKKNNADNEAHDREVNKENDPPDNLFESEITSPGNQENINESKLEEEMASTVKPIKRECGQGDRTVRAQAGTIKYMAANGQVKFTRRIVQEDPWSYHWTSLKSNYWVQKCKLQIAYSRSKHPKVHTSHTLGHVPLTEQHQRSNTSMERQSKQPTLEEIIGISNELIPDVDNFGGYLKSLNYAKDRDDFLKDFEATMARKNPEACLPTVHYVGNKLILEYKDNAYRENLMKKLSYNGNYEIHKIVYEKIGTDEDCAESVASTE
ncbi:uncharacterized protein LOC105186946 [Harpegnathos saltator]|uniref:uncharacterized protein LOC105186946 n=1 Tax=Harpegnathos saltator TaxID=610380 RepID=UPI00058F5561|nr:uncharacterized protein LOC105186946 [Harpegnathos saltator]XP_019698675.1 uncharacterized protein LOC105186946 [Harpegnathos saltator]XP_025159801.1 uncharacterized protein LOC105186946 [Harpegnathos saltator]XP_025159802.1 uncharacterized protein LOC105186946 [Harpegnathos saltator]